MAWLGKATQLPFGKEGGFVVPLPLLSFGLLSLVTMQMQMHVAEIL